MKKKYVFNLLVIAFLPALLLAGTKKDKGEFYEIVVYHFVNNEQQQTIEQYLRDAYLPALHRLHLNKIGAFIPLANDTAADKRLYLIIPISSLQQAATLQQNLMKDPEYLSGGKTYLDAVYNKAAYGRMEVILLKAFPDAPFLNLPALTSPKGEHIYELRSYESASEKIFQNKVKMFNQGGEVTLFKKLNFNAVFYASVVAGSRMPNLMYMTSFENMKDRDTHWKSFTDAPEWKKLSSAPEYQNNVIKNDIVFLKAAAYSDY